MAKRRTLARTAQNWGNLFNLVGTIAAGYIGAQHRAELDRVKAENLALKNQIEAVKVGKIHNDVLIGDLTIEEKLLKIQKLRRELGIASTKKDGDLF